jgi:putative aldouronate transport system substrate-binding protein
MPSPVLSRRNLIGLLSATFAAACSPATSAPPAAPPTTAPVTQATARPAAQPTQAPAQPATTPGAAVVSRTGRVQLPTYIPPNSPPPDVPGGTITPPGYTSYPQQLIRSVADPPAKGGQINIITETLNTLPTPMDSNPVWQELNKRVGATLNINITPFADYSTKLPTILASEDIPDMLYLPNGFLVAGFPQFLEAKCADLTPFLSGDAVKAFPNLAAHPTSVWKTVVINNKIFGVGDPVPPFFWVHWHHAELLQQAGLQPPQTAADYRNIMQTLQKPNDGLFGIVAESGYLYGYGVVNQLFTSIYGGPNQWQVDNGKLVRLFETEQFKAALGYARDLWSAGLYEPGSPGYNTLSARQAFVARKGVFRWDGNTTDIFHSFGAPTELQPPPQIRLVPPFGADSSTKPTYPLFHGSFGTMVLKKASEDRIRELLSVLNLIASPFGTEEYQLIAYGLEGRDFTRSDTGTPVFTDQGRADWIQPTMQAVVNPARVYFDPLGADYVPHVIGVFKQYEAVGVTDPTVGYYSESNGRQGVVANQRFGDGITDIVVSRRPLSDLDSLLGDWRSSGGDQVRQEFEDAMSA